MLQICRTSDDALRLSIRPAPLYSSGMRFFRLLMLPLLIFPAAIEAALPITTCNAVWLDPARNREVPVRIRMPAGNGRVAAIIFSHGLGGSLDAGTIWARAWASDGFAVVNVQHFGSDSAVFGKRNFRAALNDGQLIVRARDIQFVLNELTRRPFEGACDLGRIDHKRIGMAGHSFGALTTQAIAGQNFEPRIEPSLADSRIKAAIGFSPSPPLGGSAEAAFASIRIPFLSITGTADELPMIIPITARQRQLPFRLMPSGNKFLLVLAGGTHVMFAGQYQRTVTGGTPTPHIRNTVIATTTAFWRAMLDGDKASLRWLESPAGLWAGLPAGDAFENK
jgi:predicted dienelactone hydrolase